MAADPERGELGATLLLEDGTRFDGEGLGARTSQTGEVVFTTGMVGYPEALTDPSYRGQILTFSYPLLGNYGFPSPSARDPLGLPANLESDGVQVRGVVVRGMTRSNHWAEALTLDRFLREQGIPGISGVDTRRLIEHLRSEGVIRGVLSVDSVDHPPTSEDLAQRIRRSPGYAEQDYVSEVSVRKPVLINPKGGPLVAVLDCGVKASILRALANRQLALLRLPHNVPVPDRWEGCRVQGLVIGNGPGDPEQLPVTIEELRRPSVRELPTLGICLGHQLIALARGGTTFKLKFGHRGQNKTVCFSDGHAVIVSENHGYAVAPESLRSTGLLPWATNPDDGTLEGMRDRRGRLLAVQGHPEGHPGPREAGFVFDRFREKVERYAR